MQSRPFHRVRRSILTSSAGSRHTALAAALSSLVLAVACGGQPDTGDGGSADAGAGGENAPGGGRGGRNGAGGAHNVSIAGTSEAGSQNQVDAECGNGELEPGEICDDGNEKNGDGCADDCKTQDPDYDCSEPGHACIDTVVCGNGVLEGDEHCDEGEGNKTDGCSKACDAISDGWSCPRPGRPCVPVGECGNGIRERGEECDDNNLKSSDGCSKACALESGFVCLPEQGCVALSCGDGNRTPDEACDDGNSKNSDGCSSECQIEEGYRCGTTGCRAVCGDGLVRGSEACDDANRQTGDGCSSTCAVEPYYRCSDDQPSVCESTTICGDGELQPGEICDPGEDATNGCFAEPDENACLGFVNTLTETAECGNHLLEFGEECDGGVGCTDCEVQPGYACPAADYCLKLPECGNGAREVGEECDDGNTSPDDGCDAECLQDPDYVCVPGEDCVLKSCGDGNRTRDEECDDNNEADGDGCSSMCTVEPGYRCSSGGCRPTCGDGLLRETESCDDGNRDSRDGCSAGCAVEPYYTCDAAEPSVCTSTVICGNGVVEPGELCDPGPSADNGCFAPPAENACLGFDNGVTEPPVCGNHAVEYGEECDGGTGCTSCLVDDGFVCPAADYCYRLPVCGDGLVQPGEECDVAASTSLACKQCVVQSGWYCSGSAPSVCVASVCGDGVLAPNEQCDDGAKATGDGCSATCTIETGWVCPPGHPCKPRCGDGLVTGNEECDSTAPAGCTACRLDAGYDHCTSTQCTASSCGNGTKERGEGCDDSNNIAGDGCGPTCQHEPTITPAVDDDHYPTVALSCGDGLKTGTEQCDDGNTTPGDGCSATCAIETGWYCSEDINYPTDLEMKVVYRDFKQRDVTPGGHPHMKVSQQEPPEAVSDPGITGTVCTTSNTASCGRLDQNGKPRLAGAGHKSIEATVPNLTYDTAAFALWYRDTNAAGVLDATSQYSTGSTPIEIGINPAPMPAAGIDTILLERTSSTSSAYVFSDDSFYPLDGRGYGKTEGQNHNYQFTTELRYFFQYRGGESLTFFGDDDVWVFVNGRLAVDIGGIHAKLYGRVLLGDDGADGSATDSNCTVNNAAATPATCSLETAEANDTTDKRFGLTKGNVYEIVLFQAERHPTMSNFRLTLDGFIAPRSFCETVCGDEVVAGTEVCDAGSAGASPYFNSAGTAVNQNGVYGACDTSCSLTFCGDAINQSGSPDPEACDNGYNISTWVGTAPTANDCAPGCKVPGYCGDGILQSDHEVCDDGTAQNTGAYGHCKSNCSGLGGYCGDGTVNGPETCDTPDAFVTYGTATQCGYDCQPAPHCGDGVRNGPEQCDGEPNCNDSCEFELFCGDGLKAATEACDYGDFGFDGPADEAPYGGCTTSCELGPYCGDEIVQTLEECDNGLPEGDDDTSYNGDGNYNGCGVDCVQGARCGDGIVQEIFGEDCDNGFNDDTYAFDDTACGANCTAVPYCGDGILQSAFEICDDGSAQNTGAYGKCKSDCSGLGGFCGDGKVNGSETCDTPGKFAVYGNDKCGFDCQPAPYCGDDVRNGPEQCDGSANCTASCEISARCGDGVKASTEACDYGSFGFDGDPEDAPYGGCTVDCELGAYCGDGQLHVLEECDEGKDNQDGLYGGCQENCSLGPRCGDAIRQGSEGEACDNGYNEDTYAYVSDACGPGCTAVPSCGDGKLQSAYELCDDGKDNDNAAYDGCRTDCTFGPYCGDGKLDKAHEACDLGAKNSAYSADGEGCGYDCQPAPYCGDGVRNGPEACDDGTKLNTGDYGQCNPDCTEAPYCGDGVIQKDEGEECDDGPQGSFECSTDCVGREGPLR